MLWLTFLSPVIWYESGFYVHSFYFSQSVGLCLVVTPALSSDSIWLLKAVYRRFLQPFNEVLLHFFMFRS